MVAREAKKRSETYLRPGQQSCVVIRLACSYARPFNGANEVAMLHTTSAEHYEKLRRVVARLDDAVHKDDLDDFIKTAYHLIEATEKDPASTANQKAAATALRKDSNMQICRDICNGQEHFTLDPRRNPNPRVCSATTREGFGVGRFGKGGYGIGEQSVTINLSDGTQRNAHDLVRAIAAKWAAVF